MMLPILTLSYHHPLQRECLLILHIRGCARGHCPRAEEIHPVKSGSGPTARGCFFHQWMDRDHFIPLLVLTSRAFSLLNQFSCLTLTRPPPWRSSLTYIPSNKAGTCPETGGREPVSRIYHLCCQAWLCLPMAVLTLLGWLVWCKWYNF